MVMEIKNIICHHCRVDEVTKLCKEVTKHCYYLWNCA